MSNKGKAMGDQHNYVLYVTAKSRRDRASMNAMRLVHRGDSQMAVVQVPTTLPADQLVWLTTVPTVLERGPKKTIYPGLVAFAFLKDRWLYVEKTLRSGQGAPPEQEEFEDEEEVDPSRRSNLEDLIPRKANEQDIQDFARTQMIVDPPLKKQRGRGEELE